MATKTYFSVNRRHQVMFGQEPTLAQPKPPAITVEFHDHIAAVDDEKLQAMIEAHPLFGKEIKLDSVEIQKPAGTQYTEGPATTATENATRTPDQTSLGNVETTRSSGKGKGKRK